MADPSSVLLTTRLAMARLPGVLDALLGDLAPADWRARPVAPEWAPIEIVCHLRDEEVEDFGARVRVALEGGSRFTPIDTRNDGPRSGATETQIRGRRWRRSGSGGRRVSPSSPQSPPIASRPPSSIRDSGGSPVSTSSSRGSPTIGCT